MASSGKPGAGWHIIDEELHSFINDQQSEIGTYLYGRRLYELMAATGDGNWIV